MAFQNQKVAAIMVIWVAIASLMLAVSAAVGTPAPSPSAAPTHVITSVPSILIAVLGFIII
ncbi:hypothetical protein Pyn_25269 [Prunus yedoensis var. nudiflora]|uniref:Uncharacterized protein n=1 Tax=Prunus yedoensis var. nudiflora TaxID=2094558 RepID=A0A314XV95_PRUYE|nr:hypothetical protein Pyn_25269 [Prunus yedoensis var. nudiflora]